MATIKDVARLAGVGLGTASRAISGRGAVAPDTLRRVQDAVQALNFRPSNVARALSLKTLGMLGVYVPHFSGWFNGPILSGVDEQLRAVDRHMVTASGCGHGDARQQALEGIDFLLQRECDGIIVVSDDLTDHDLVKLKRRCEHMVVLNRHVKGLAAHCFSPDHDKAGRLAARALLSRGHRDIATISGPGGASDNEARMSAFMDELSLHGVKLKAGLQVEGDYTMASGHAATANLLRTGVRRFSAVFAANDQMAVGAIARLTEAGLSIPSDVSVMGYDDSPNAAFSAPSLTTVRMPFKDVAVNACRFLIQSCYGVSLPVSREFALAVVWRLSVVDGPHLLKAPRGLAIPTAS